MLLAPALLASLAVGAPAVAALVLLAAPTVTDRPLPERAIRLSAAGIALTATAVLATLASNGDSGPLWQTDRLAMLTALLLATIACADSWPTKAPPTKAPPTKARPPTARPDAAARSLCLAGAMLAALAQNRLAGGFGIDLAVIACLRGTWTGKLPALVGLATALCGMILLGASEIPALGTGLAVLRWDALLAAAPAADPTLLSLGFATLLAGYGAAALALPAAGIPSLSAVAVVATTLLRSRAALAENPGAAAAGTLTMLAGLAVLVGAAIAGFRPRDVEPGAGERADGPGLAALAQAGAAVFGFGLGGPAAAAGLLLLTMTILSASAAATASGPAREVALLAAGFLPPFGVFAGAALLLGATAQTAPLWTPALALGLAASALGTLRRTPRTVSAPPWVIAADAPAWALLAITTLLGFAMPAKLWAWFEAAASGVP